MTYPPLNKNRQRLEQFLAVVLSVGIPQCLWVGRATSFLRSEASRGDSRERRHTGRMERDPENILTFLKTVIF